jgi:hypothetical protein
MAVVTSIAVAHHVLIVLETFLAADASFARRFVDTAGGDQLPATSLLLSAEKTDIDSRLSLPLLSVFGNMGFDGR